MSVSIPQGEWYPLHLFPTDHSFAILTGTKGENRKAVVATGTRSRPAFFLKIPLTDTAASLVRNEAECLTALEERALRTWVTPKVNPPG